MLSASMTEVRTGHEGAVRAFAEMFAGTRGDGFFDTNRAGVISSINARAAALLDLGDVSLEGRPLTALIAPHERPALQRIPRTAGAVCRDGATLHHTARACGATPKSCCSRRGRPGWSPAISGWCTRPKPAPIQITGPGEAEPALLARISRGVRRPLNTIIGFSDLIRSEAFGALGNERYESYAQDIRSAGHEIAALVDELDDYTRLRDGRYLPQRASIDLMGLLESCVVRIRNQANSARVIVRSAISETLPKVTADRASLAQAVLNLSGQRHRPDADRRGGGDFGAARGRWRHRHPCARQFHQCAWTWPRRFVVFRDGMGRDGQVLAPVRSSVGLALTRSLLAVNAVSLSVDPAGNQGMLFSLVIPADLVDRGLIGAYSCSAMGR